MGNTLDRQTLFQALGLVDWRIRPSGALAARSTSSAGPEAVDAPPDRSSRDGVEAATAPDVAKAAVDAGASSSASIPDDAAVAVTSDAIADAVTDDPSHLDWADLEIWLGRQDHRGATQPVFGVGARDASVLIVGEAPGANEDAQGVPFVGRAGKLLDRMLFAIGCARDTNVYITNICKFRPPGNRDPNADEVAADWPVLERQIDLMQPKLVVAVGRIAAQTLLDCKTPLGKLRGQLHRYPRRDLDVLVTYHPAYLLRSPDQKSKAWDDLRQIAKYIGSLSS